MAAHEPKVIYVTNVVSTFHLGCALDIQALVRAKPEAFKFTQMSCGINFRHPPATCSLFTSGSVNIVGVAHIQASLFAAWKLVRLLWSLGYRQARVHDFRRCNMTSTVNVGHHLNLEYIKRHGDNVVFHPQMFPGARMKMEETTLTIFRTGCINITGSKSEEAAIRAFQDNAPLFEAAAVRGAEAERELQQRLQSRRA